MCSEFARLQIKQALCAACSSWLHQYLEANGFHLGAGRWRIEYDEAVDIAERHERTENWVRCPATKLGRCLQGCDIWLSNIAGIEQNFSLRHYIMPKHRPTSSQHEPDHPPTTEAARSEQGDE